AGDRLRLTRLFPLLKTPSTKFYGKSRTRSTAPRTQFAAKFPWRCLRRRRMSADDGDVFILFDSLREFLFAVSSSLKWLFWPVWYRPAATRLRPKHTRR